MRNRRCDFAIPIRKPLWLPGRREKSCGEMQRRSIAEQQPEMITSALPPVVRMRLCPSVGEYPFDFGLRPAMLSNRRAQPKSERALTRKGIATSSQQAAKPFPKSCSENKHRRTCCTWETKSGTTHRPGRYRSRFRNCYHRNSVMQTALAAQITAGLRKRFNTARNVLVLTGAGVSAESGVPTFRGGGNSAVWKGLPFDVISSARMVERDLPAVWDWFDYRRAVLKKLSPNAAHQSIARWENRFPEFSLVTQNVDGLHQKAGSQKVIELHGNIWRARCVTCQTRYEIPQDGPRSGDCHSCGDRLRPDVVLFGEILPPGAFERAADSASQCDLCFVVGTSALVYPAASLPEIAKSAGAYLCEVNPERTPLSDVCDVVLTGQAGQLLPLLEDSSRLDA
jgi:NAD-dependent protein deacetylase/lipoamidase